MMQGFRNFENYIYPEKMLFLDIDGVLQPFTQNRFDHIKKEDEIEALLKELEEKHKVDYRKFSIYDVAAVYYDWDLSAIKELKRVLDETKARIVISSSWREGTMGGYFPELLKIHDLHKYLYGYTPEFDCDFVRNDPEYKKFKKSRSAEISSYLRYHPFIKKWVAVDDMDLTEDFPKNAVKTSYKLEKKHADACIEILV